MPVAGVWLESNVRQECRTYGLRGAWMIRACGRSTV